MKVIVLPALLTGTSTNLEKMAVCKGIDRKMGNEEWIWTATYLFLFIIVFTTLWDGINGY